MLCSLRSNKDDSIFDWYVKSIERIDKSYDPMLAAMLSQPWSNNACRGYVIYAMENCGFSPNDIRRVVAELYEVFDFCSLEEAQQHFEESPY